VLVTKRGWAVKRIKREILTITGVLEDMTT
jgi:hypothetical protein